MNRNGEEREEQMREGEEEAPQAELLEIPEQEIARLRDELEAKKKEAEFNYERFLRATADLENFKKRAEKEKAEFLNYANDNLITEVLPVVDNFERALAHANSEETLESLRQGVKLTIDQLNAVLKKYGLQDVKAEGEKFDPSLHHAITEEERDDIEPGIVTKEFQRGYFLKGRLLRPSMVAVSKKP